MFFILYTSGDVDKALKEMGIKKAESRAYHPQSQGKIERSHGTWKTKMRFDIQRIGEGNIPFVFTYFT